MALIGKKRLKKFEILIIDDEVDEVPAFRSDERQVRDYVGERKQSLLSLLSPTSKGFG